MTFYLNQPGAMVGRKRSSKKTNKNSPTKDRRGRILRKAERQRRIGAARDALSRKERLYENPSMVRFRGRWMKEVDGYSDEVEYNRQWDIKGKPIRRHGPHRPSSTPWKLPSNRETWECDRPDSVPYMDNGVPIRIDGYLASNLKWIKKIDKVSGYPFFYNRQLNTASWDRPPTPPPKEQTPDILANLTGDCFGAHTECGMAMRCLCAISQSGIKVWDKGGGLYIWPHMKIAGSKHDLRAIADQLKNGLMESSTNQCKVEVWRESTYAAEINGPWNVVMSISFLKDSSESSNRVTCMYMVRRCVYYDETYFCPFMKTSRAPEELLKWYPNMMKKTKHAIKRLFPNAARTDSFPTHDIEGK